MNDKHIPDDIKKEAKKLVAKAEDARIYIENLYNIRKYFLDLALQKIITEKEFYLVSSLLTPQARSVLWQNYFAAKVGAVTIKAEDAAGDIEWNGKNYEFKISGFNADKSMHVVQIRLWQKCDYIVQYLNIDCLPPLTFILSHQTMVQELQLCKASSAHGTVEVNKENINTEYRFTVHKDGKDWNRWVNLYHKETD